MSPYHLRLDGTIDCDTVTEALALRDAINAKTAVGSPFSRVLMELCRLIPIDPHAGRGPKPKPMSACVYDCAMRVYLGSSARKLEVTNVHYNTAIQRMGETAMSDAIWRLLNATEHAQEAEAKWGPIMAKKPIAVVNEQLLRRLVARVVTLSGGA